MQNEGVVMIGYLASHYADFSLDNLLHIVAHSLRFIVSLTINHDAMGHALYFEGKCLEIADFNRRVVKDIEILGAKGIPGTGSDRQPGCYFPGLWRKNMERRRRLEKALKIH